MIVDVKTVIVVAFISIVVLLLIREVMTWYWKINQLVWLLKCTDSKLTGIHKLLWSIDKRLACIGNFSDSNDNDRQNNTQQYLEETDKGEEEQKLRKRIRGRGDRAARKTR